MGTNFCITSHTHTSNKWIPRKVPWNWLKGADNYKDVGTRTRCLHFTVPQMSRVTNVAPQRHKITHIPHTHTLHLSLSLWPRPNKPALPDCCRGQHNKHAPLPNQAWQDRPRKGPSCGLVLKSPGSHTLVSGKTRTHKSAKLSCDSDICCSQWLWLIQSCSQIMCNCKKAYDAKLGNFMNFMIKVKLRKYDRNELPLRKASSYWVCQ